MPEDKNLPEGRRLSASERRASKRTGRPASNPYMMRTAAQRRAERSVVSRSGQVSTLPPSGDVYRTRAEHSETNRAKVAQLDAERIANLLENPTKIVTTEQLRAEYGYVVADIRSMFLLAGSLVIVLIVLALVLPR